MSDIKKYNINIKTISPIHIGSGESYGTSEFIPGKAKGQNGPVPTIKRVNLSKYYLSLSDDKKDKLLQSLSTQNFELKSFDSKISNDFKVYTSYDRCKEAIRSNQEIEENIKTLNELYLPGSSIKGAIKTAILFNSISPRDIRKIDDIIRVNRRTGKRQVGRDNRILDDIFSASSARNKAQASIMKFLQVADSSTTKVPAVYDVISVMATENGSKQFYKRHGTTVRSFLECIRPNINLKTTITTNYNEKTYARLDLDDKERLIDIDFIKKSIYDLSSAFIDYELEFSEKYGIDYLNKFYRNIQKDNNPESPLLKVGAGSGFLATTIGLKIKEYDDEEFENYFEKVRQAARGHNYQFEYPKSRKIIAKGAKPLGWVKLTFN